MIVPMQKIMAVVRGSDRDKLLDVLGDLGVIHLVPVDAHQATASEDVTARIGMAERALQVLRSLDQTGSGESSLEAQEAIQAILEIERANTERAGRLSSIHRQLSQQVIWGDVRLEQFESMKQAGLALVFCQIDAEQVDQIDADFTQILATLSPATVLVGAVGRGREVSLPEGAVVLQPPAVDNPALKAEAAAIDAALRGDREKLTALRGTQDAIQAHRRDLGEQAKYDIALRGGLHNKELFALQGWIAKPQSVDLAARLQQTGLDAAIELIEPGEDETPPTLIRYPRWANPIKGLFDILSTFPGYHEMDLSPFFMVAMPVFAAILIGDAGYGLLFTLATLIFRKKLLAAAGKEKTQLVLIISITTIVFGVMIGNYFGITPESLATAGGYVREKAAGTLVPDVAALRAGNDGWAFVGRVMMGAAILWDANPDTARNMLIQLSFLIGTIHLVLAHVRQIFRLMPSQKVLAEIGWCLFLTAILGVLWIMFFGSIPCDIKYLYGGLIVGAILAVLFSYPHRNPIKRIAIGLASSILPALGTFSDTVSYIRLMAVGMASYYVAVAFNQLASDVASSATWIAGAPIALAGHALNIILAIIAIFAHGVRLNMLEFSNNAGVQWGGYEFTPFKKNK